MAKQAVRKTTGGQLEDIFAVFSQHLEGRTSYLSTLDAEGASALIAKLACIPNWGNCPGHPAMMPLAIVFVATLETVARYSRTHLAADHLHGAACWIDGTFAAHKPMLQLVK